MEPLDVIPYVMYIIMIGIIVTVLYIAMRETGIREIKYLIFGFIGIMFSMIQYTGTIFLTGQENEDIAQKIFSMSAFIAVIFGWNLLLFGFLLVTESKIPIRYYFYVINNSILLPIIFTYYVEIKWVDNSWEIIYTVPGASLLVGLGIFALIFETTYLFASVSRYSGIESIWKLFTAFTILIFASVPIFILRDTFNLPLHFYLLPVDIAFLIFATLIYQHPEVFQTSQIIPQFLLVLQTESGVVLKMYHFIDNSLSKANSTLMASALTALQYMFQEMSNKNSQINYIGLRDSHLSFCYSERYLFILGSERRSSTLSSILTKIRNSWVREVQFMFSEEDETALDELVKNAFIYQINRLNLLIQSEDTMVSFR